MKASAAAVIAGMHAPLAGVASAESSETGTALLKRLRLRLNDLDAVGNILEYIGHHDMDNATSDLFSPKKVLYTSEIGMVVPDVPANVTALNKRFGLDLFRGQSSAGFTALGDTRGLLLIVKKGRGWLPINSVKSDVFPVEVTLGHGNPGDAMDFGDLPYVVNLP